MIEFNGYLSGSAEKYFHKQSKILGRNILLISVLALLPVFISIGISKRMLGVIFAYLLLFPIVLLLSMIPQSKKEKRAITPKKIFTEGEYIICLADKYSESRLINEAKLLRDYGEFYMVVFPFGRLSDKFICQKNLITKGTINEFEKLFGGKIVRMKKYNQTGYQTGDGSMS